MLTTEARHVQAARNAATTSSSRLAEAWDRYLTAVEGHGELGAARSLLEASMCGHTYAWAVYHCTVRDSATTAHHGS